MKTNLLLIITLSLASLLRLFLIGSIPPAITHDEADILVNAKSYSLTGFDLTGTWTPWQLLLLSSGPLFPELPSILLIPTVGTFDFTLITSKIPFVLT